MLVEWREKNHEKWVGKDQQQNLSHLELPEQIAQEEEKGKEGRKEGTCERVT